MANSTKMMEWLTKKLWKIELQAEEYKERFEHLKEDCQYYKEPKDYTEYDDCTHPRNVCKSCNYCNCGFAENPLEVM
jgi:hypothetical protein